MIKLTALINLPKLHLELASMHMEKIKFMYDIDAVLMFVSLLLCLSGICADGGWMFLWQSQTGSMCRRAVPLLSALSPPQSLRWSPLFSVKALSRVQLHLCCACHQVLLHSYSHAADRLDFQWINPSFPLFLFQVVWTSWARLHSKTTVQLCGLWHCRCVAVLHSLDHSFERSFTDRGLMSSYNER